MSPVSNSLNKNCLSMSAQVTLVFVLTFVIHLVSTLSYALRIAGVRTGRIAVSLALFNVLMLVSRTSNTFQAPLLAKHVERNILGEGSSNIETDLRWMLLAATLATLTGIVLIPTFQRLFTKAIATFGRYRSIPRLLLRGFSLSAIREIRDAASFPAKENITGIGLGQAPRKILLFNVVATSLITVGVFASLYAGYLQPELRVTANNLSPVVNALSTILLFVFIDPYLSLLTDDVVSGKATEAYFRRCVALFAVSRLIGTIIAQLLLVPAAKIIGAVAKVL
jgi:hypothetical protein